ncbi:HNHc domain-containing protein [Paraburkholderia tropica]|uniref:HNH endonuclease n=1 Tax=Paraburkholderia tropica TaxID=92647 RepID=UPI001CAC5E24|nr:HNH endonuclease [Paraburkholderia tropica]CAG9217805.1 HNHc domain-containing protein [Paraburkholderia tropica]
MILAGRINANIMQAIGQIAETEWNSGLAEVIAYRDAVLVAQRRLCAYCKRRVYRNEVGFRELDHILPKAQNPRKKLNGVRASSNDKKYRRHTTGYPQFMYNPENLVIACKRCNGFKGSYDALADRSQYPVNYPALSNQFEWIHPYHDEWSLHIKLVATFLYAAVDASPKGTAVIHACGLDKAEELTKRLFEDYVDESEELVDGMMALIHSREPFDTREAAERFARVYGKDPEAIRTCLIDLQAAKAGGSEVLARALDTVSIELGEAGRAILPVAVAAAQGDGAVV